MRDLMIAMTFTLLVVLPTRAASAQDRNAFIQGFGGVRVSMAPGIAKSLG